MGFWWAMAAAAVGDGEGFVRECTSERREEWVLLSWGGMEKQSPCVGWAKRSLSASPTNRSLSFNIFFFSKEWKENPMFLKSSTIIMAACLLYSYAY